MTQMEELQILVTGLKDGDNLIQVRDSSSEIQNQFRQFELLSNRAENTNMLKRYLNNYDAMLRLIEVLLLQYGYRLGEQPHATARKIIAIISPSTDFRHLANVRHNAKKQRIEPHADDLNRLIQLIGQISQATEHLSQNE